MLPKGTRNRKNNQTVIFFVKKMRKGGLISIGKSTRYKFICYLINRWKNRFDGKKEKNLENTEKEPKNGTYMNAETSLFD